MVYQNTQIIKISPAFLQRLIDAVRLAVKMYKVELRTCLKNTICRVRTAHQPLKAPEGIKRTDSE